MSVGFGHHRRFDCIWLLAPYANVPTAIRLVEFGWLALAIATESFERQVSETKVSEA
jgi:hypothetical protein